MPWFPPYVPVGARRARVARVSDELRRNGVDVQPVHIEGHPGRVRGPGRIRPRAASGTAVRSRPAACSRNPVVFCIGGFRGLTSPRCRVGLHGEEVGQILLIGRL